MRNNHTILHSSCIFLHSTESSESQFLCILPHFCPSLFSFIVAVFMSTRRHPFLGFSSQSLLFITPSLLLCVCWSLALCVSFCFSVCTCVYACVCVCVSMFLCLSIGRGHRIASCVIPCFDLIRDRKAFFSVAALARLSFQGISLCLLFHWRSAELQMCAGVLAQPLYVPSKRLTHRAISPALLCLL